MPLKAKLLAVLSIVCVSVTVIGCLGGDPPEPPTPIDFSSVELTEQNVTKALSGTISEPRFGVEIIGVGIFDEGGHVRITIPPRSYKYKPDLALQEFSAECISAMKILFSNPSVGIVTIIQQDIFFDGGERKTQAFASVRIYRAAADVIDWDALSSRPRDYKTFFRVLDGFDEDGYATIHSSIRISNPEVRW